MEGVENIAPLTDSTPSQVPNTTPASSSNNKNVPSAETATEQSTVNQKKNTEGSSSTTNNGSSTSPPQLKWVTIESQRKKYQVAITSASLPGEKLEEKKQYAFDLLKELPELVSFTNLSINGTTYIGASFLSLVSAEAACKLAVSQDNPAKFDPVPEIRNRKAALTPYFL